MCLSCRTRKNFCDESCRRIALLNVQKIDESFLEEEVEDKGIKGLNRLCTRCAKLYDAVKRGEFPTILFQTNRHYKLIVYALIASKLHKKRIDFCTVQQFMSESQEASSKELEVCVLTDFGRFLKTVTSMRNNYDVYNFVKYVQQRQSCTFVLISPILPKELRDKLTDLFALDCKVIGGIE